MVFIYHMNSRSLESLLWCSGWFYDLHKKIGFKSWPLRKGQDLGREKLNSKLLWFS